MESDVLTAHLTLVETMESDVLTAHLTLIETMESNVLTAHLTLVEETMESEVLTAHLTLVEETMESDVLTAHLTLVETMKSDVLTVHLTLVETMNQPCCLLALLTAPYVKQCRASDPLMNDCFIRALHHLQPFLAKGIPEIELPSVEPFRMDELSLSLTTGPNGYKITLRDIDIYNLSNFTVSKLKIGGGGQPFETRILMPELKINARYTSSGVLIIIPASGNGTFHATLGGVAAILRGTVSSKRKDDLDYLTVESLNLDLNIKTVRMIVKKVFNNNRILSKYCKDLVLPDKMSSRAGTK
uniref:Uncharacterized protein n=1 Tax=Timema bartmani TaxID=61472 RepID=A0A7R9F7U0_9NEOP|nr:unnamed protein product [Timema bartmani]